MAQRQQEGTLIRGADGLVYRVSAAFCQVVEEAGIATRQETAPWSGWNRAAGQDHRAARVMIEADDGAASRVMIEADDGAASRVMIEADDGAASRVMIEADDGAASRVMIEAGDHAA